MNHKTELLAPAGDWEAFMAAVENGADAIYMGGKLFNARQFAGNFDNDQLKKAIDYAHVRDVSIYLTLNTLLSDNELGQAVDFAADAYRLGIDGIIVQDIGFAGLLNKVLPELPLHASTQMTIYNLAGVRTLEKLGFKRAVLARELSIEEIRFITENTSLEIEIFIHGALCISYSGQCLMSSIIGGRSGNRGKCAQPCRLPYELLGDKVGVEIKDLNNKKRFTTSSTLTSGTKGYLMSPKDLCSLDELQNIVGAGVKSLKIEGRMKSPEYVATVVKTYRKYLDELYTAESNKVRKLSVNREDMRDLTQIFNRGGFTKGYLTGKTGRDMMSFEKPKNWGVYLGEVVSYDRMTRTVKIMPETELSIGDGIEVWNGEGESPGTVVSEIRLNGKPVDHANEGETVSVGRIDGRIDKGNKVYKTSDKGLIMRARESFKGRSRKKVELEARIALRMGQPALLTIKDKRGNEVEIKGEHPAEAAINRPLDQDRITQQINKTGATPFEISSLDVDLDENISLPLSELNDIRRRALEEMEARRSVLYTENVSETGQYKKEITAYFPGNSRKRAGKTGISVLFYNITEDMELSKLNADRVYVPFSAFLDKSRKEQITQARQNGCELFLWLPSVTRGNYDDLIEARLDQLVEAGVDGLLAGNLGLFEYPRYAGKLKIAGDYSLNSFNSISVKELESLGLQGITLSMELNLGQLGSLRIDPGMTVETVVYGRIPLMTSEYCPVGSVAGDFGEGSECNRACMRGSYRLKDRMGVEFPVYCDRIDCRSTILNSNVIFVPDSLNKIAASGVDLLRINITDEKPAEVYDIVNMHKDILENGTGAIKRHNALIERIKDRGFTKGHYFRGV